MKWQEYEIRRRQRVLEHALQTGQAAQTCRYFGVPRSTFYRWKAAFAHGGVEALARKKPVAHSHPNQTPPDQRQ